MPPPKDVLQLTTDLHELGVESAIISIARRELGEHPDDPGRWLELAAALRSRGDKYASLLTYETAARRFPTSAQLWNNKGVLLRDWGRLADAVSAFDRALEMRPNYVAAIQNKGTVLEWLGHPAEAAEMYRNAVELEPHNATAWTDLANAENACGNRLAARRYYERAIELDSQSIDALFNFAAFLYNLEERALALVLIDRALALDPNDGEARALRERILDRASAQPVLPAAWTTREPPYVLRGSVGYDYTGAIAKRQKNIGSDATLTLTADEILSMDRADAAARVGFKTWDVLQLDRLVEEALARSTPSMSDRPYFFISYRWESDPHIAWVGRLADDLLKRGYAIVLDRAPGEQAPTVPDLIARMVECSHFVAVLTEAYRRRIEVQDGTVIDDGWVYDEFHVALRLCRRGHLGLLGLWRSGPAVPMPFRPETVVDMRDDLRYTAMMDEIFPRI